MAETIQALDPSPQQSVWWSFFGANLPAPAQIRYRIDGPFDRERFRLAVSHAAAEQEALRTVLTPDPATPSGFRAALHMQAEVVWSEGEGAAVDAQDEARRFQAQEGDTRPLVQCRLVRGPADVSYFLVTTAANRMDGSSAAVFGRRIAAWFSSEPAAPAATYAQFTRWQQSLDCSAAAQPPAECSALPIRRSEKAGDFCPIHIPVRLSEETLRGASHWDTEEFLFACWVLLIGRLAGTARPVVERSFRARVFPELAETLGLMDRSVPMTLDVESGSALDLAGRVSAALNQTADLLDEIAWPTAQSTRPRLGFEFLDASEKWSTDAMTIECQSGRLCADSFGLQCHVLRTAEATSIEIIADLQWFEEPTVRRVARQLAATIENLAAAPSATLSSLDIRPAAERVLLERINRLAIGFNQDGHILDAFREHARQHPERLAATDGTNALTYGELAARAGSLARRLRAAGVGPETICAVAVERTPAILVAIYGILWAGGAYLPLDPNEPQERHEFKLADSAAAFLVTTTTWPLRRPEHALEVMLLDPATGLLVGETASLAPDETPLGGSGRALAYVIYTSGSTGQPKGVTIEHRSVVALQSWAVSCFRAEELRGAILSAPVSFDMSVFGLFVPAAAGGAILLVENVLALAERSQHDGASLLYSVPTAVEELLRTGGFPMGVQTVNLGGEPLRSSLVEKLLRIPGVLRVCNMYGPTEDTSNSMFEEYTKGPEDEPTLGVPIANSEAYVLDEALRPALAGVEGEIYLGGAGLARGYFDRPELTAERFIRAPWNQSERLYRTGDRGVFREDGRFQYIGRIDGQIKIRGYRVECAEIELRLAEHPAIEQAAVFVRNRGSDDKELVTLLVLRSPQMPDQVEIRAFLRERLPTYMIPASFAAVPDLPRSANGKLDRRALANGEFHDSTGISVEAGQLAGAGTPHRVARVWQEVLGGAGTGWDVNFFEAGGHSLLLLRLAHRLGEEFGRRVPLRDVLDRPTISQLAAYFGDGGNNGRRTSAPLAADTTSRFEPFPLTPVQEAYWIGSRAGLELGNVATHGYAEVDMPGFDAGRFAKALHDLIRRHDMLRVRILPGGEQRIEPPPEEFGIEVLDLRTLPRAVREQRALSVREEMSHRRHAVAAAPLVEVRATQLTDETTRLHISLNSLVADAQSVNILARELTRLYRFPGEISPHPAISFRDCVLAMRAGRGTPDWERDAAYWRERLKSFPPGPALPLAREPSKIDAPRFARCTGGLDASEWQELVRRAKAAGLTPSGVLLAVFAKTLAKWSEHPRFAIDLTLFNRPPLHPDIDRLVGDFTALELLEVDCACAASFSGLARQTQDQLWRDLDHGLFTGMDVIRELRRERGGEELRFPVVFTSTLELGGDDGSVAAVWGEPVYSITQSSQVWLDLKVRQQKGRLIAKWDYVEGLFPPALVEEMAAVFDRTLSALASGDTAWSSPLSQETAPWSEKRRAYNATSRVLPASGLLQDGFEANAQSAPERIAVIAPGRRITYRELRHAAGAIAAELAGHVTERQDREPVVGIVMRKGWEQVAAALGILFSGAAYLPLDPNLPDVRLRHIVESAQVRALVADVASEPVARRYGLPVVVAGEDRLERSASPLRRVAGRNDGTRLAYVIYTSGSTGQPKGVTIDHGPALNTIAAMLDEFPLTAQDRVFGFSSLSFDLSVYDIFATLSAGAALVLPGAGELREPAAWLDRISSERVTVWNSVPSAAEMLVEHCEGRPSPSPLENLRFCFLSGDRIPVTLPGRWRRLAPACELVSLGGATEASIWSIYHRIDLVDPGWTSIPYGQPLPNQTFYVLDADLEDRPDWAAGELYIGGAGLARGYLGDPGRTRERFVVRPSDGERLYRTGDLGRFRPEGWIEFLGRCDRQVKIRGHRVELGEIEAALLRAPNISAAVVDLAGPAGKGPLTAYFSGDSSEEQLRKHLADCLPEHMSPTRFVRVRSIPRTANGKIDYQSLHALRGPENESAALPMDGSPTLAAVCDIWREILGTQEIAADTDYYAAGGDSVRAVRLNRKLRERFGADLPLRDLLRTRTPAAMASVIDQRNGTGVHSAPAQAIPQSAPELLLDPAERARFKERHPGVRRDLAGLPVSELAVRPAAELLTDRLNGRRTVRTFSPEAIPLRNWETFLSALRQNARPADNGRFYPSAGGLYPVQVYVQVKIGRVQGLDAGTYYYEPLQHQLVRLDGSDPIDPADYSMVNRAIAESAAFAILLVCDSDAIRPLYGKDYLRLVLLEAGYLGQLMMTWAPAASLGLCPIGQVENGRLRAQCRIGEHHVVLHAILGGLPAASVTTLDAIRRDAAWPPEWAVPARASSADGVFLTGATGFLGVYLVAELLAAGCGPLYCLVRGASEEESRARLRERLALYGLHPPLDSLQFVVGDVSEPRLGLSPAQYAELASHIGTIYHNGARVSFVHPYEELRGPNVTGTAEILRLACSGSARRLHFVSSIAAFSEQRSATAAIRERDRVPETPPGEFGYGQSKWAAERLVAGFQARGGEGVIFRPAQITGDARTGRTHAGDYLSALVEGCWRLGLIPDEPLRMPLAPVDYVAKAMVTLSLAVGESFRAAHLINPDPATRDDLLDALREYGRVLQPVPYAQFLARLESELHSGNPLVPYLPLLRTRLSRQRDGERPDAPQIVFDASETMMRLAAAGIPSPPPGRELIARHVGRLFADGRLPREV